MHARPAGWQSMVLALAVLASVVAGVMVARADAESQSPADAQVQQVPDATASPGHVSGRAVEETDAAVGAVAPSREAGAPVTVAYTVERGADAQIHVTEVDNVGKAEELVDELAMQPQVVAAEIDTVYAALRDGPERERQWGLELLQATRLWTRAHACGQTIAIVDSGVNGEHPDLAGVLRSGKDMVGRGTALRDASGHGTEVTGVAAAAHGNGRGISGMAPGVRVVPVAIEDAAGQMHASDLARGIRYAIAQDVGVINLSLGGPVESPNVEYWLERATAAGIPVVAAAGNAYRNDNPTIWPAASAHTIAVGAVAPTGVWASFSSSGTYVDVVAPGVAVLTTGVDGGYVASNGTSLAAPFVSATLAMMRARDPELTPDDLRKALIFSARDLGPAGWDPQFGHGLVDPLAAMAAIGGTHHKCFRDIGALTLADQIERLAFAGVTDGCAPGRFCPAQRVTRGQMATFLSRTISQPSTDTNFFDDVHASAHEQAINRLAQANIARGCTATSFCPNDPVTRGQMATFIARALDLPPTSVDAFTDDTGDLHEAAINSLAAAKITGGCDAARPELFCPGDTVTRAQMAAFLMRMIDTR